MTITVYALKYQAAAGHIYELGDPVIADIKIRPSLFSFPGLSKCIVSFHNTLYGKEAFFEIPLNRPESFQVDETNWFELLEIRKDRSDVISFSATGEYSAVPERIHWLDSGISRVFVGRMKNGDIFGFYVKDGKTIPKIKLNRVNLIKTPHDSGNIRVLYSEYGIHLVSDKSGQGLPFSINFEEMMSPQCFLQSWLTRGETLTVDPDNIKRIEDGPFTDNSELVRFFDFEYFSCLGGKVVFTIQKDPVIRAMSAMMECVGSPKSSESQPEFAKHLKQIIENGPDNKTRAILEYVVDYHMSQK